MNLFKTLLPVVPLLLASACDEDLEGTPDRGALDAEPISFRPVGGGGWGGSTRLNTAQLFPEGMPLRHFERDGDLTTYDDPATTKVRFRSIRVHSGGVLVEYLAATNNIQVVAGVVKINGTPYLPGRLLGSEWRFEVQNSTLAMRPVVLRVTGVALADIPGGTFLPLYNFSLTAGTRFYTAGPFSTCDELDPLTTASAPFKSPNDTPPGVPNAFKLEFSSVLYGNVKVSETGTVLNDETLAFIGCASGAIGKSGLWGYPPWVSSHLGRTGVQQLQAASRAIRADFCADGVSHTADGTPIQVRDRFTAAFTDPTEVTESVWGTNGSVCKVDEDRLDSGSIFDCGGALSTDCDQSGSDWITGPDQFMWIKVDPARTSYPAQNPCGAAAATPGCSDPGIEATVCASDAYCCNVRWDATCVNEVTTLGATGDACCADNGGPGCGDVGVEACVATFDPYCATGRWDSHCATEVEHLGCGLCR